MKIHSLAIKGLYGELDYEIKFYGNVNFLTGINGSGKTSVLNVIYWTLTPSLLNLVQLEFDEIKLSYKEKGKGLKHVVVRRDQDYVEVSISHEHSKLKVPIFEYSRESRLLDKQEQQPSMLEMYERFKVEHKGDPVLKTLEELIGPFYLPMGRRWQAARTVLAPVDFKRRTLWRTSARTLGTDGPIAEVLYLAEKYYRERQFEISQMNEKLRDDLVSLTFEIDVGSPRKLRQPWKTDEVKKRKEMIVRGLKQAGISVPEGTVAKFFDELERIVHAIEKEPIDPNKPSSSFVEWLINEPKVGQVERIIRRLEEYHRKREQIFKKVNEFIDTVNSFLKDSGKALSFNPSGELIVKIGAHHEIRAESLASGESQLLILFSFLYFGFDTDQEFIMMIDEPELSLHLGWQHQYVNAVMKANPNAQFIFATHSPEITQSYKDNEIELKQKGL